MKLNCNVRYSKQMNVAKNTGEKKKKKKGYGNETAANGQTACQQHGNKHHVPCTARNNRHRHAPTTRRPARKHGAYPFYGPQARTYDVQAPGSTPRATRGLVVACNAGFSGGVVAITTARLGLYQHLPWRRMPRQQQRSKRPSWLRPRLAIKPCCKSYPLVVLILIKSTGNYGRRLMR